MGVPGSVFQMGVSLMEGKEKAQQKRLPAFKALLRWFNPDT